jgi:protein-S-isoprenylcysteine O-methyltransferase Ste14
MTEPYFDINHAAGALLLVVVLGWLWIELAQFSRGRQARAGATKVGGPYWWIAAWAVVVVTNVVLYSAPHIVPAAAIRPGAVAFAIGMAMILAGLGLRGWAFLTLGGYFTFTVMVSSDQPVIAAGPYRLLRHPSYTGLLLASAGVGVASANWVAVAALTLLPLALIIRRIHVEENALLATLDGTYRAYASHHKRLVPLVW